MTFFRSSGSDFVVLLLCSEMQQGLSGMCFFVSGSEWGFCVAVPQVSVLWGFKSGLRQDVSEVESGEMVEAAGIEPDSSHP